MAKQRRIKYYNKSLVVVPEADAFYCVEQRDRCDFVAKFKKDGVWTGLDRGSEADCILSISQHSEWAADALRHYDENGKETTDVHSAAFMVVRNADDKYSLIGKGGNEILAGTSRENCVARMNVAVKGATTVRRRNTTTEVSAKYYNVDGTAGEPGSHFCVSLRSSGEYWLRVRNKETGKYRERVRGTEREVYDHMRKIVRDGDLASAEDPNLQLEIETLQPSLEKPQLPEICGAQQPAVTEVRNPIPHVVETILPRVKDTCGMGADDLSSYLYMCMCRNRKLKNGPIINTRLMDMMHQPIYIVDKLYPDEQPSIDRCVAVCTLDAANEHSNGHLITEFPAPLKFYNSADDLVWNPTMPLLPIMPEVVDHILKDNQQRLPEALQSASPSVAMEVIQNSLNAGVTKACMDYSYALPSYSSTSDAVGLMLPLYVPLLYGEEPVGALMVTTTLRGYRLATMLTLEQARRSVRAFRDPKYTWLKGV